MHRMLLVILTVLLLACGCVGAADRATTAGGLPTTLRVGLIPNISPEQQRAKYQPFADYLLSEVTFTGGHDATAQAVLSGKAAAGGVELRILRRLETEGKVPAGALRVIAEREVQGYPWVIRTALGDKARQTLTDAFTAIDDPALLDLLRAKRYEPVRPSDYDEIRQQATELGLLR